MRVLLCFFSFLNLAQAYTPPPAAIIEKMLKDRTGLKSVEWSGKITDIRANASFVETLRVDFVSGRASFQYATPSGEVLAGQTKRISEVSPLGKFWLILTLDPNQDRVFGSLHDLELTAKKPLEVKLGRSFGKVFWVFGEKAKVSILKDEFYPMVYQSSETLGGVEVSIRESAAVGAAVRVAKNIFIKDKSGDLFQFELKSVKIDIPSKVQWVTQEVSSDAVRSWVNLVR